MAIGGGYPSYVIAGKDIVLKFKPLKKIETLLHHDEYLYPKLSSM
jgi:hypothetical protein